jgi:PII-like signaling protein
MNGFQVTFFTQQGRRQGHQPIDQWLMDAAKSLGIKGITTAMGVDGVGRNGKLHSAHFFELADQPIEVTIALSNEQCEALFARIGEERVNLFYVKTAVEYGVLGNDDSGD